MRPALIAAAFLLAATSVSAAAPSATAPPRVLNIVRQTLKPATAAAYAALEATIVRSYDRARMPLYWIALQSVKDPREVLYLNLFDAREDLDRATAAYNDSIKKYPELTKLAQRLTTYQLRPATSMLTSYRDEIAYTRQGTTLATMEALRLTVIHVHAGREGEFLEAAQPGRPVPWLLYEDTSSSTFFMVTPLRSAADRKGGGLPRALRRLKRIYTAEKPVVYAVRHAMSHASPQLIAANRKYRIAAH